MAAYLIFRHKVLDADKLNNDYLPKAGETLGPYSPEILVVDENIEVVEGPTDDMRTVVLKFQGSRRGEAVVQLTGVPGCRGATARRDGRRHGAV